MVLPLVGMYLVAGLGREVPLAGMYSVAYLYCEVPLAGAYSVAGLGCEVPLSTAKAAQSRWGDAKRRIPPDPRPLPYWAERGCIRGGASCSGLL